MIKVAIRSFLTLSLWQTGYRRKALAGEAVNGLAGWVRELHDLGRKLRRGDISPTEWQAEMDRLNAAADLQAITESIDWERLASSMGRDGGRGEKFVVAAFDSGPGIPESMSVETKLGRVKRGRAIFPHGHDNMVSAFLVLSGELHLKQYDKVKEESDHMIIRPTRDERSPPGTWSSVSDEKNNVHWLQGLAEDSYLFSTKMVRLDPKRRLRGRVPLDVSEESASGGAFKAYKINVERARELYG